MAVIAYLHGVGGPTDRKAWLEPLNVGLGHLALSPLDVVDDDILDIDYSGPLRAKCEDEVEPPPLTLLDTVPDAAEDRFRRMTEQARLAVQRFGARGRVNLDVAPQWLVAAAAGPVSSRLKDAQIYRTSERARARVLRHVLDQIPDEGELVLVGHSLGSVVGLDLIRHLPPGVFVRSFITVGSPLSTPSAWPFLTGLASRFPYDRVGTWINVADGRDPVAGWNRVSAGFPMALDVPVVLAGRHEVLGYFSHPAVAAAVADGIFGDAVGGNGSADDRAGSPGTPARRVSPDWNVALLAFAFSNELSRTCKTDRARWKRRFDTIRSVQALRTRSEISQASDDRPDLLALNDREAPSMDDLLVHAADIVVDTWSDDELLPLAVSLYMSSPTAPFDVVIDDTHRKEALEKLLRLIRRTDRKVSEREFMARLIAAVETNERSLRGRGSGAGWWLLFGAAILAATGVGLVAAAPVGLAGAAALSATLASFGPGGMVGGMVTIAALTGTGGAFVGAAAGSTGKVSADMTDGQTIETLARTLKDLSVGQLRHLLVASLAVCDSAEALGRAGRRQNLIAVLESAQGHAAEELELHDQLAPRGKSRKEWADRLALLDRALGLARRGTATPIDLRRELDAAGQA